MSPPLAWPSTSRSPSCSRGSSAQADSRIPRLRALTPKELARFDRRVATPTALRVLRSRLSPIELVRVLGRQLLASLEDPLDGIPPLAGFTGDRDLLVRAQLRPAVRLDDATRAALRWEESKRLALLTDVVAETGAAFIAWALPVSRLSAGGEDLSEEERRDLEQGLEARIFNARLGEVRAGPRSLDFDVEACAFHAMCHMLGRPYLAPMFCEADARLFSRPDVGIELHRAETLARGGDRCAFRLRGASAAEAASGGDACLEDD